MKSATLNVPTQVIQVTTKGGRNLEATWVGTQDNQITRALQQPAAPRVRRQEPAGELPAERAARLAAVHRDLPALLRLHEPDAGRRLAGHELRQVPGEAHHQGHPEDDVRRRGRRGRGDRGARGDQGVPPDPGQVPGHRRQDPQGRPALRAAGNRQDPARPRRRRRGRRAVLLDLGLGLRRDVRRRRRLPRARPVRAGQGQRAGHRVRGRDRRRRPPPRGRIRRRA